MITGPLPGDAGGPVLDENGHVFGMLLPAPDGARRLPEEVRFALTGQAIARALETSGLRTVFGEQTARLDPVKLAEIGEGLTVRVSCWE